MGYVGSYVWKLRQKVGNMTVMTATVDVIPVRNDGKIKMVFTSHIGTWTLVGGHVELGDSWGSAAINELEEEAGIVADKNDLKLFATISGPDRVYHYQDGDTRPYTIIYLIHEWQEEREATDKEEILESKWVTLEEAKRLRVNEPTALILDAYEEYLKTGKIQAIEQKGSE